jgi:hypothetical protein
MKYHNDGMLRNAQDSTLFIRPGKQKRKLTWVEYLPLLVLGVLLIGLLAHVLAG